MSSTTETFIQALVDVVGADGVSTSMVEGPLYGRDLWPQLQLDRLAGIQPASPRAIVWPQSTDEVAQVVRICAAAQVPIVPFGAGSGVCGGAKADELSVVLDLKRLKAIRNLDLVGRRVEVEAGLNGERFERILNRKGFTLGHFPSSILCSTVGGWVAARSAGQCSSRYGKIEDMIVDLEVVTPDGVVRRTPSRGRGLDWTQILVGSEGTLGIITAVTLVIHPEPAHRVFRGWLLPTVDAGIEVMRRTMQDGLRPSVMRLYDALDTRMVGSDPEAEQSGGGGALKSLLSGSGAVKGFVLRQVLGAASLSNWVIKRWDGPVLLVTVCEGGVDEADETDAIIAEHAWALEGQDQGEGPGRAWMAHRYDVSFKQSKIYKAGAFVDTFEVATTWDNVETVYEAVREAAGQHVIVMAHFSHAYPGGCSIYFTMAGSGGNVEKMRRTYRAAWQSALDAAHQAGAAIAHHHGVGLSRLSHMAVANGAATNLFGCLKKTLDPEGIMNPGKVML